MGLAVAGEKYTYAETGYANPHAPSTFFNGTATTTYAYDANGNLTGTTGASTSTFMWDYRNRMIAAWVSGATSTYAYDRAHAPGPRLQHDRLTMQLMGKRPSFLVLP